LSLPHKSSVLGRYGLLAAVSRIAAILPNDLAPTNMNGPLRTLASQHDAAMQLSHSRRSSMSQQFLPRDVDCADFPNVYCFSLEQVERPGLLQCRRKPAALQMK